MHKIQFLEPIFFFPGSHLSTDISDATHQITSKGAYVLKYWMIASNIFVVHFEFKGLSSCKVHSYAKR